MTCGELDALRIERGYPNGDVLSDWFEAQFKPAAQFEQLSLVVEGIAREQQVDDLDGFFQSCQRRIEFHAVEMFDHLRAAGAQADSRSAIGELIERPKMLRQSRRRARINIHDRGGQLNPAGVFRQGREQRERIVSPRLRDPDRMDSRGIGNHRPLDKTLDVERFRPIQRYRQFASHVRIPPRLDLIQSAATSEPL